MVVRNRNLDRFSPRETDREQAVIFVGHGLPERTSTALRALTELDVVLRVVGLDRREGGIVRSHTNWALLRGCSFSVVDDVAGDASG